jgi:hypothetical protein
MNQIEKKAYLLLKSVIFHYHGLDEEEKQILDQTANELNAQQELQWANDFIAEDYPTAFDRARVFLNEVIGKMDKSKKIYYLDLVWKANNFKGYITEMEATAMLQLARDWEVETELIQMVRQ